MEDHDLPIDIHSNKLLDWLVSRREVKKDWSVKVRTIREKINHAIQDMPEHPDITRLLSGTYITYFHCQKIVEVLKETEKDTKNMLGWYGSQRMKDWQEIAYLYEKDSVYLAEAAQLLMRNVKFEIPELRQHITKRSNMQKDCDRREEEYNKTIADNRKKYHTTCRQIGIAGEKVEQELMAFAKDLPEEFAKVAAETKVLAPARQLYLDFLSFTVAEGSRGECLPLLKYIMEHGNVTIYEWTYGEAPCKIEEPQLEIDLDDDEKEGADDEIDFGDMGSTIDFGSAEVDPEVALDEPGDIDWGNLDAEEPQTIDWDIVESDVAAVDIVVEDSGVAGGVAKGKEAMTLLANEKTRNEFIDELHELVGFLKQRITELGTEDSSFMFSQMSLAPESVQDHNIEQVEVMVALIRGIIDSLNTSKMHHLYLISSSPKYVKRMADSLRSKLAIVDKIAVAQEVLKERKKEIAKDQQQFYPKLELIIERTKELKTNIEKHISKRYKNRPVNIMAVNLSIQV